MSKSSGKKHPPRMAVHCVAGLGRAPLLVALALIHRGCEPINAIELIRSKRTGALNMIQANFLVTFKENEKHIRNLEENHPHHRGVWIGGT